MLAINIPQHTTPDKYELGEVPSLVVEGDTDILIKVHAASINPIDVKKASGATKLVLKDRYEVLESLLLDPSRRSLARKIGRAHV